MSKQREALRLAYEALDAAKDFGYNKQLMELINEALADESEKTNQCGETCERAKLCAVCAGELSKQEPVAWTTKGQIAAMDSGFIRYIEGRDPRFVLGRHDDVPLYTASPARKPLADIELWKMWVESPSDVLRFARAIERAHGIGDV